MCRVGRAWWGISRLAGVRGVWNEKIGSVYLHLVHGILPRVPAAVPNSDIFA